MTAKTDLAIRAGMNPLTPGSARHALIERHLLRLAEHHPRPDVAHPSYQRALEQCRTTDGLISLAAAILASGDLGAIPHAPQCDLRTTVECPVVSDSEAVADLAARGTTCPR